MNSKAWFQKNRLLSFCAAVAVCVPPAAFLTGNFRVGHPVFQAVDLVFAGFLGAVLAANVLVWRHVLRGTRTRAPRPAPGRALESQAAVPAGPVRATVPAPSRTPDFTPAIFHQLVPFSAAGEFASAAPLCGLDSTLSHLHQSRDLFPGRDSGRFKDFRN